mgnify:CR=1 FL=1
MSMKKNQEDVTPQIEEEKISPNLVDSYSEGDSSRQTSMHAQLIKIRDLIVAEDIAAVENPSKL